MKTKPNLAELNEIVKFYGGLTPAAAACGQSERNFRRWFKGSKPTRLGMERIAAVLSEIRRSREEA